MKFHPTSLTSSLKTLRPNLNVSTGGLESPEDISSKVAKESLLQEAREKYGYLEETFFEILAKGDSNCLEFRCKLCNLNKDTPPPIRLTGLTVCNNHIPCKLYFTL